LPRSRLDFAELGRNAKREDECAGNRGQHCVMRLFPSRERCGRFAIHLIQIIYKILGIKPIFKAKVKTLFYGRRGTNESFFNGK
jgi:hypothetical protein